MDPGVRADGQNVLTKLDDSFDVPLDIEIFAPIQLALDDDRCSDVHGIPVSVVPCLSTRHRIRHRLRGSLRHGSRFTARRPDILIALPHGVLRWPLLRLSRAWD